jgi:rhomboid protease GluP
VDAAGESGAERLLEETADRRRAYDLALVLDAEGIRHRLEHEGPQASPGPDATPHPSGRPMQLTLLRPGEEGAVPMPPVAVRSPEAARAAGQGERLWRLWVRAEDEARGRALLAAWSQEERAPLRAPEPAAWEGAKPGLLFAVLCIAGQLATGPRDEGLVWFARGTADAARILHGEAWRALTALTLHADLGHALGNAACGWFLLHAVSRRVGPAWAAWLALLSGLAGNLLTAMVAKSNYLSIGASTAVFGVLGALTALQTLSRRRRGWITIGAGVALLSMLGTGEKSDLLAHLFGFLAGGLLAIPAGLVQREAPRPSALQPLLALGALLPLGAAWALALR